MINGSTIFALTLVAAGGCTRHNDLFSGGGDDLSAPVSFDLSAAVDLATTGDLSGVAGTDLATAPADLATVDLAPRTCGGPSQPCCGGNSCDAGGCCNANVCVPSGRACGTNRLCTGGSCVDCGGHTQPCCADDTCGPTVSLSVCCDVTTRTCVNFGEKCGSATCGAGGSCGGCGGTIANTCCPPAAPNHPSECSASGTTCVLNGATDSCQACGGSGQPCCDGNSCATGGCCVAGSCRAAGASCAAAGGKCKDAGCNGGACGRVGQACCANGECTAADSRCLNNQCVGCGGADQRCCFDPSANVSDFCERPYQPVFADPATCFCRT